MSTILPTSFTKEQLFADLEKDGIDNYNDRITKAKKGDEDSMNMIGSAYQYKKRNCDKAMAWFRLAAAKNNSNAQNNIGLLYHSGIGVSQDYLLAMEWFLKAATQNHAYACGNIGDLFEDGHGVPQDKYKALEWYCTSGKREGTASIMKVHGNKLKKEDKDKPTTQLIMETEDILRAARKKREDKLRDKIHSLKQLKIRPEQESCAKENMIKSLEEQNRTYRAIIERQQQEKDATQKSIEEYKRKEQTMTDELQAMKQAYRELELKLEAKEKSNNVLEGENKQLQRVPDDSLNIITKRIDELEKANQNLDQERQLKANEIELLKQKMEFLSETANQKIAFLSERVNQKMESLSETMNTLENENKSMKRKLLEMDTVSRKKHSYEKQSLNIDGTNDGDGDGADAGDGNTNNMSCNTEMDNIKFENVDND